MNNDKSAKSQCVTTNPWTSLGRYTDARIGLGRSGVSLPTQAQLAFQLAHANARDAVHIPLDFAALQQQLAQKLLPFVRLHSQAVDRTMYLQRPDMGRKLDADSIALLNQQAREGIVCDATLVLADGLSSTAVQQHGALLVELITQKLSALGLSCSQTCLVEQGRVAIGDEIGALLASRLLILVVGERPGLSSPDSLGIYYTYQPKVGLTDDARNCISNIRPAGLTPHKAVKRLIYLVTESLRLKLSGVQLKDRSLDLDKGLQQQQNFLLE